MAAGFNVLDALNKNSKAGKDGSPKGRFRVKDVPIDAIYKNALNFYRVNQIEELAGDILLYGLKQNLEVIYAPCEKGEYRLVAGERRWEALKYLVQQGYEEFKIATCKLTDPKSEEEEQVEIIVANEYRTKTAAELLMEEKHLKESLVRMKKSGQTIKGYDLQTGRIRDVIAKMLKTSRTKVAQLDLINKRLIPGWKKELKVDNIPFSTAYELSGMSEEEQEELLKQYETTGEVTQREIRERKLGKVSESDTNEEIALPGCCGMREEIEKRKRQEDQDWQQEETRQQKEQQTGQRIETQMGQQAEPEYQTPHPKGITSLCYSCTEYETCNVKTGTCMACDQYKSRAEAYKTEEQRYDEEQKAIDRETRKRLREMDQEKKMEKLPSDQKAPGKKVHQIKLAAMFFDDVASGRKSFEIRKNDRGYKVGDILEMMEFKSGKETGRMVRVKVTYMMEEYTGIEEGYCVMGIERCGKEDASV